MTPERPHLLNLFAFHTAGPGVLDQVFGPDGDFEGAPYATPTLLVQGEYDEWEEYRPCWMTRDSNDQVIQVFALFPKGKGVEARSVPLSSAALDLRTPSTAFRLLDLLRRIPKASLHRSVRTSIKLFRERLFDGTWTVHEARDLVDLSIGLAPLIAKLGEVAPDAQTPATDPPGKDSTR
jgi:hypothetical protein